MAEENQNPQIVAINTKKIKQPAVPDPRWLYKAGETPVLIHNIDAPGWIAQGWSHDPNPQPQAQEPEAPAQEAESQKQDSGLLDLNTATEEELVALKFVGKAIAQRLIAARPLESLDQAFTVSGFRPEQWQQIKDKLTV